MDEDIHALLHGAHAHPGGPPDLPAIRERARARRLRRRALGALAALVVAGTLSTAARAGLSGRHVEVAPADQPAGTAPSRPEPSPATPGVATPGEASPGASATEAPSAPGTSGPACPDAAGDGPPPEAVHVSATTVDARAAGSADPAWVYVVPDEGAYVHVAFAAGGSARTPVTAALAGGADLGGASDVGGGRVLWLNTALGASGPLLGLVAVTGCSVQEVVTDDGEPLQHFTGGSARGRVGFACDGRLATWDLQLAWDEDRARPLFDEPGSLRVRHYRLDGAVAVLVDEGERMALPDEVTGALTCDALG